MTGVSEDVYWYIYKTYNTHHILPHISESVMKMDIKRHFKNRVLDELLYFSTGEYISKLINNFIKDHPKNFYVRNFSNQYWDTFYYMFLNAHVQKKTDIFLFTKFKDAVQAVYP